MSRNAIFDATLAIGQAIEPGDPGSSWGETGRKLKAIENVICPALFQVEPLEDFMPSRLGQMPKRELSVLWFIFHNFGKDQAKIPAEFTSDLIDKLDAALNAPVNRQTLGGLVYAVRIEGQIQKWEGDLDGLTIFTVPIKILLP